MSTPIAPALYRAGLGLKAAVRPALAHDHRSAVIDRLRGAGGSWMRGRITVRLAQVFGFCYGVERAVQYAYETRRAFPDRRIVLVSPIIHNPQVNARLEEMGIDILGPTNPQPGAPSPEPRPGDVAIIPAFGVTVETMARLRASGAVLVDTTCGSVMAVWKSVERLAREGFTVVMHGNPAHEETRATLSRVDAAGGRWVVVRDPEEAKRLAEWIAGPFWRGDSPESPRRSASGEAEGGGAALPIPFSTSPGFDPARDLRRNGLAHQTTTLASESALIAETLRNAAASRWGLESLSWHFRDFDTICSATQDRQDAMETLAREGIDLCLVVGGRESHNTAHLAAVAGRSVPAYHIEGPEDIVDAERIRHWGRGQAGGGSSQSAGGRRQEAVSSTAEPGLPTAVCLLHTASNWLPPGPVVMGVTAGASTPDAVTGAVVERVLGLG